MTKQRFSDIEDAVLIGLLEAPTHNETPFKVDTDIFTTPLKRKIAATINNYITGGEPELALFRLENAIDENISMQHDWIEIQGNASKLGFGLPISVVKRYYDDLVKANGEKLLRGER